MKIKDISQNFNGYINFTVVLENGKVCICCSMYKDVEITDADNIPNDLYEKIYKFGKEIKKAVTHNTNEFLSHFKGIEF